MHSQYQFLTVRDQSCPNNSCSYKGHREVGNVVIHSQKERRFRCNHCRTTWVAHIATPEYGLRKPHRKFHSAYKLLDQGLSIRKTARLLEVSPTTIQRWKNRFATANFATAA